MQYHLLRPPARRQMPIAFCAPLGENLLSSRLRHCGPLNDAPEGSTDMHHPRALCKVIAGPNAGDVIALEVNACRLIGRHLSEHETSFIDRDGNRMLDAQAHALLGEQLGEHLRNTHEQAAPSQAAAAQEPTLGSFERGPDVIFADDAISRAHAMLFYDPQGVGIVDLASTNGTYVNTQRISLTMLHDGDVIALGSSEISFHVRHA